ncbi:MAG: hypothetical protein HOB52_07975 [Euryarchaeota archaeon]|nr:hypothetical protein [Euryarchaeota archaeon]
MMIPAHALAGIISIHLGRLAWRDKDSWLWVGIAFAFFSHAIIDALAIFTYHDGNPSGSMYSQIVFWFWLGGAIAVIYWALNKDRRYGYGILAALIYDLWDHWFLRGIACVKDGFPNGCMDVYAYEHLHLHHFEWFILDTVFAGVERHYGDESYFIIELLFVTLLSTSIWWLRKHASLPMEDEEE